MTRTLWMLPLLASLTLSCQPIGEALVPPASAQAAVQAAARSTYGASIAELLRHVPPEPDVVFAIDLRASADVLVDGAPLNGHEEALSRGLYGLVRAAMLTAFNNRAGFDPLGTDELVVAAWFDEQSVIAMGDVGLVPTPLTDGASAVSIGAGEIRAARRGNVVIAGLGARLDQAVSRDATAPAWLPEDAWPAGWAAMPREPVAWAYMEPRDFLMREAGAGGAAGAMRDAGISRFAIGVGAAGDAALAVAADRADTVESWFGAVPAGMEGYLAARIDASDAVGAQWLSYLRLLTRASLARWSLARDEGVVTLTLAEPVCEGAWRQSVHVLAFAAAVSVLEELDRLEPAPWQTVDVPLLDTCDVIDPGAGRIDTSWLAVAPEGESHMLMMIDVSWAMRAFGVSPGGLLGAPLDPAEVDAVRGASPMGVAVDGADQLLVHARRDGIALAGPSDLIMALPQPWRIDAAERAPWGTLTTFDDELSLDDEVTTPWSEHPDLVASDVPFALALDGDAVRNVADELFPRMMRGGVYSLASQADSAVFTLDDAGRPVIRLVTTASADEATRNLRYLLTSVGNTAAAAGGTSEASGRVLVDDLLQLLELVEIVQVEDGVVEVQLDVDGEALLVGMALPFVAISGDMPLFAWRPTLYSAEDDLHIMASGASVFWDQSAQAGTPRRFPVSTGPTQALDVLTEACEAEEPLMETARTDNQGWIELGLADVQEPVRFVYQFESHGTDQSAEFTATAFGDLDCDGELREMRIEGHTRHGWVEYDWNIDVADTNVY